MTNRLVFLASGNGSNLQAVLNACETGELPAQVVAVISDHKAAYALVRAKQHSVPAIYHAWKPYKGVGQSRQEYDTDLAEIVASYNPDLIVLGGWMRILTMSFLSHFPMRVINLHPALPGTFPGTHAIQRAYKAIQRDEIEHTGVMVHFVPDEGVDNGPVIAKEIVPIYLQDSLENLEERIHAVEHRLLIKGIAAALAKNSIATQ